LCLCVLSIFLLLLHNFIHVSLFLSNVVHLYLSAYARISLSFHISFSVSVSLFFLLLPFRMGVSPNRQSVIHITCLTFMFLSSLSCIKFVCQHSRTFG
jgi:hypothetical protein